ncbi:MAG: twin-arginine translocase TatA/TatE family subunit [Planctomycetota bacterium]
MIEIALESLNLMAWFAGGHELLICAIVFMVLFGGAKLPGLMRNLGRSVNEFKAGIKEKPTESHIEDNSDEETKN